MSRWSVQKKEYTYKGVQIVLFRNETDVFYNYKDICKWCLWPWGYEMFQHHEL